MKYAEMAISVTDLNKYIKNKIADDEYLNNILIKGEISNFKHHYTGHLYFTLKDENSLIKCIMFKSYAQKLNFEPRDGMKVYILGSVSVFERDGVYQIYAKVMEEDGLGDLYTKYQKLKAELEEKGLFDQNHKKKIPMMPKVIGVLTSQTGSVIRDIINVSTRRNPNVYIRLLPVPVQGEGAGEKIAEGIDYMNQRQLADVIILARGGGSLEDLWPFNEEVVAYSIYQSKIPIISAVGHETDFSISDFVADLRAPTPSAAAELAVPDIYEVKQKINTYQNRLNMALTKKLETKYAYRLYEFLIYNRRKKNKNKYISIDDLRRILTAPKTERNERFLLYLRKALQNINETTDLNSRAKIKTKNKRSLASAEIKFVDLGAEKAEQQYEFLIFEADFKQKNGDL